MSHNPQRLREGVGATPSSCSPLLALVVEWAGAGHYFGCTPLVGRRFTRHPAHDRGAPERGVHTDKPYGQGKTCDELDERDGNRGHFYVQMCSTFDAYDRAAAMQATETTKGQSGNCSSCRRVAQRAGAPPEGRSCHASVAAVVAYPGSAGAAERPPPRLLGPSRRRRCGSAAAGAAASSGAVACAAAANGDMWLPDDVGEVQTVEAAADACSWDCS